MVKRSRDITISKVVNLLKKNYTYDEFARKNNRDPFRVLIACILSLRTKDKVTEGAARRLFRLAKTPEQMIKLSSKQIEKAIYPVGFYRVKAKTIIELCKKLICDYDSKVPGTVDELLKLKGVGRKTANIVMTFGFNKDGIAVDTHVHRISNRLGWVKTRTPHETEFKLKEIVPKKYWILLNELFVRHGQNICVPISPKCSICMIRNYCEKVGVSRHR